MSFQIPEFPYRFDALEPAIDAETMRIHYTKHHQGYVNKLNDALKEYPNLQSLEISELLTQLDTIPNEIRTAVQNNAGGHYNHSLFWTSLTGEGGGLQTNNLLNAIMKEFGTFEKFKETFGNAAKTHFGSGWAWLVYEHGQLKIMTTVNQDNPISQGKIPLLGLDVWEHAYYLHYQNRRADYVDAWWSIVNWPEISDRFNRVAEG